MRVKLDGGFKRVAFVSTRISGTDGVSLETRKWAEVLESMGLECCYIAGESDRPSERTVQIEEAHFEHPQIQAINRLAFGTNRRTPELTELIVEFTRRLREKLCAAIETLGVDVLIAENCLTIPMNIPLGVALVQIVQEMSVPCLAHHHDFYWERKRYLVNGVNDFIHAAFPPPLAQIEHVVINSLAAEEFSRRTGLSCRVIPNVMDFANPPIPADDYASSFRREIGLSEDDLLILQPPRVVARKGIERAIELVRLLGRPRAKLVITHSSGDEGHAYGRHLRRYAELLGVDVVWAKDHIADKRGVSADGHKLFVVGDAYSQADLVTYPSTYEGFGNAFLEAVYYRQPIICNRYAIYHTDIEPYGFRIPLIDGFVTDEFVEEVRHVLDDDDYRREMVEHNYELGRRFFSYDIVEHELLSIFRRPHGTFRMLHRLRL